MSKGKFYLFEQLRVATELKCTNAQHDKKVRPTQRRRGRTPPPIFAKENKKNAREGFEKLNCGEGQIRAFLSCIDYEVFIYELKLK